MKVYSFRLWPNGEFGLGRYPIGKRPKLVRGERPPIPLLYSWSKAELHQFVVEMIQAGYDGSEALSLLSQQQIATLAGLCPVGSSNAINSHKRAERGSKGITSYGKRVVRNGCWMIEKACGTRKVAMLTLTIPSVPPSVERAICEEWAEIMRVFNQWLYRRLKAELPHAWIVGVVEVQEKRLAKYGGLPLHSHLVFQSRLGREHIVRKHEFCDAWKRAVCSRVPSALSYSFASSTRVEQCKKSVAGYLSKYMSKGITDNVVRSVENGYKLPSSWWFGVGKFKQYIKRSMVYDTGLVAELIWTLSFQKGKNIVYSFNVTNVHKGIEYVVGVSGRLSNALTRAIQSRSTDRIVDCLSQ